jgi:hypothetical protein
METVIIVSNITLAVGCAKSVQLDIQDMTKI